MSLQIPPQKSAPSFLLPWPVTEMTELPASFKWLLWFRPGMGIPGKRLLAVKYFFYYGPFVDGLDELGLFQWSVGGFSDLSETRNVTGMLSDVVYPSTRQSS